MGQEDKQPKGRGRLSWEEAFHPERGSSTANRAVGQWKGNLPAYFIWSKFFWRISQSFRPSTLAWNLAFSSSSSAATLPVTMECVEKKVGVHEEVSSFVLPLGATINMDGTGLYQGVAAVFIATLYGMDLSLVQQLQIVLTASLASIGTAAVPGVGIVMLVIVLAETSPVPVDIEDCPCLTVAIVVDWEAWSDALFAHAPGLDVILADQSGVDKMSPFFPGKMKTFVPVGNFGRVHSDLAETPIAQRAWDVTFVGGLLPTERFAGRIEGLRHLYPLCDRFKVRILAKMDLDDFIAAMCDSKILFNHAALPIQQGINARNFEAGECRRSRGSTA